MLAPQNTSASPSRIRSLVPVEGNKSLLLICSPAALVGPISRLLSWCPLKPRHCMSYLGLISVSPPREGSMAAGPSPTLDRPLLGSPLPASLACFTLSTLSLSLSANVMVYRVRLTAGLCKILSEEISENSMCHHMWLQGPLFRSHFNWQPMAFNAADNTANWLLQGY